MINLFYKKNKNIKLIDILNLLKLENNFKNSDFKINDIKDISSAKKNDITFFHSIKYKHILAKSKVSFCLTTKNLLKFIPKSWLVFTCGEYCLNVFLSALLILTPLAGFPCFHIRAFYQTCQKLKACTH